MKNSSKLRHPAASLPIKWHIAIWFIALHLLGVFAIFYLLKISFSGKTLILAVSLFVMCHLSITAGVHRLYSHRSYIASKPLELLLLLLSAATFQYSALVWVYFHRLHHWYSDTDRDPYSVHHGFWWAHFLWILRTRQTIDQRTVKDLEQNKLVVWQHRHYYTLAILMGLVLPTAVASLWHDAVGGLLVGGFLRIMVQYHSTWSINSVAHTFGFRKYSSSGTARLSPYLAVTTVGENNHERHHLAHEDYRIGPRWYHLDIGKWFIELCACLGLAHSLRTVSENVVLERARKKEKKLT